MSDESEIIQGVYAVTVEPERYDDLVVTWVEKLSAALFAYEDDPENADSMALNEHVARATKVISLLAASRADDFPGSGARLSESLPDAQPVMRISVGGKVLDANASARRAYDAASAANIEDLPFDSAARQTIHILANKLLRLSVAGGAAASGSVPLVHAVRTDNGQTVYLSLSADPNDPAALFLTSTDIVWPDRLTVLMRDSFALTLAECEVGKGLVEGCSLSEIARVRHTSISTVRVHARSLFAKTSTNGQREFIRMAIGLAALYPDDESFSDGDKSDAATASGRPAQTGSSNGLLPAAAEWQSLRLRDGRVLPYAFTGATKGRTSLYVHDALFGPALPERLANLAAAAGLRLLVIARQGWLGAPLYPEDANPFEQCAKDTRELLDHLRLDKLLLVGRVLGATYGYEIIRHDPSRYVGLLGITPALPIGEREDINVMAPHHRLLTISVDSNPTLLKFVWRAGSAIYDRFGPERFLRMVYRHSPKDLELVERPEMFRLMSAGLALGRGGAHHPFFHELKKRPSAAWHPGLDMPVPFNALLGEHDPSARQRRGERMIELGVPIELTLLPGLGELFIYSHPEIVIEQMTLMFDNAERKSVPASSV